MISKKSLRDQVREYLTSQMRSGKLKAGKSISLAGLARELGVSVTPIREALSQLSQSNIIEAVPNRGFIIPGLSPSEAKGLYEMVAALEILAIENSTFTEKQLVQLRTLEKKFSQASTSLERVNADLDFHNTLVAGYNNKYAQQVILDLKTRIFFYEMTFMNSNSFRSLSENDHTNIIDALVTNEIVKASYILKNNWMQILKYMKI